MNPQPKRPPTPAERDWNGPACEPDDDEGDPRFNAAALIVAVAVVLAVLWRWLS